MADWSTAAVALVSASAALAGTLLQNLFGRRNQRNFERRNDTALMIERVEKLFTDLEVLEDLANQRSITVLEVTVERTRVESTPDLINLGHIRAYAHLYFPELIDSISTFDADMAAAQERFSGSLGVRSETREFRSAAFSLTMAQITAYQLLFSRIRARLAQVAADLGSNVRRNGRGLREKP